MEACEMKIEDIFKIVKKRILLIFCFTIISTIITGIVNCFLITPRYVASNKLFVGKDVSSNEQYNAGDIQLYQKLLSTYAELITTSDLIDSAIKKNNLDVSVGQVRSGLNVITKTDTQFFSVTFEYTNPEKCKEILDAVTEELIEESSRLIPNGNVQVIEKSKIPQSPVTPNKEKNIAVGFLTGLIIGIVVSFLIEYFKNTVNDDEQLEKVLSIPVIGKIPAENSKVKNNKLYKY